MSSHVVFISGAMRPAQRVADFIVLARDRLSALVASERWQDDLWMVHNDFVIKGQNPVKHALSFHNAGSRIGNRHTADVEPMEVGYKEFAKAYIRYQHSASPVGFESTKKRLVSLRLIEAGFCSLGLRPEIENLSAQVLNSALAVTEGKVGRARYYQLAVYVQQIHDFCVRREFLNAPFYWKHGIKKPEDHRDALGREAKERRDKILPTPEAFHALGHIFRNADTFADQFYSAIAAICVCVPVRAHEVLELGVDCEVPKRYSAGEPYGIRFKPGKRNDPQVKWVPTQMVPVAREAIARLRNLSAGARVVAKWYEKSPIKVWLPPELERSRGKWLSLKELQLIFVGADLKQLPVIVRRRGIEFDEINKCVFLPSLAENLLTSMPSGYPFLNGKDGQTYSGSLAIYRRNEPSTQKPTFSCLIEKATVQTFERWLSGLEGRKPSVFTRWQFRERNGDEIQITTKSFRHWINTVAQLRGLSELDIAKWSGREISQNKAYDHVTPDERLSQIRLAIEGGQAYGPMFEVDDEVGVNPPVSREQFLNAQIGAAHTTDYGICVHDYTLQPCGAHGDCFDCSESVLIKGDPAQMENIRKQLETTGRQLEDAKRAMDGPVSQADRWFAVHQRKFDRLHRILSVHRDEAVRDGAVISLPGANRDSEIAMTLRERAKVSVD
ncbi:hypothetical protein AB7828_04815 [Tardiphaga sp. 215_C5_N2_1]|uniref:hypothetical protein n=1 Tax=Tardiphaga sp. 215_C5_N2_1 TaxID=3240774 RepID=UPI003F88BCB2